MSLLKRFSFSLVRIVCGVPIVSLTVLGLLFVAFSATWKGRCVGLSAVLLGSLLFMAVGYWNRAWFQRRRRRLGAVIGLTCSLLVLVPAALAPDGGKSNLHARNCYLGGADRFHRYSPWNVIPERDQTSVALHLAPLGDPYVNSVKARRMRCLVQAAHESIEQDPEFRELGSALGLTVRDLLHLDYRTGHYYLFMPDVTPGEKIPCLVFLHGMGGNIKPYFWTLSRICTRMKCAVVAPTFGMGLWQRDGSAELVTNVTHEVIDTHSIDPERVFLMGYSQGAIGVTRAAIREPGTFCGVIYLSPITEDDLFGRDEFSSQTGRLRLLFLHGTDDLRIPCDFVRGTARTLRQTGHDVVLRTYEGEDHYLILSGQDLLLDDLAHFMATD